MVTCTGHIGIHEGAYGRTDVHDVMVVKPNFLHIDGLPYNYGALRTRAFCGAPLLYHIFCFENLLYFIFTVKPV